MIITIGRQFGSGGGVIGKLAAERLGYKYYDNEILTMAAEASGLSPAAVPVCTYSAKTRTVFVNRVFAGQSTVLCAGYGDDGRLLFVRFLTPDVKAVLPAEAAAVRVFRLGGGCTPAEAPVDLSA